MHVHLLGDDNGQQLIATPAFSAPGPSVDPAQARLIGYLTAAIRPIVEERQQRAARVLEERIQRKETQLIAQFSAHRQIRHARADSCGVDGDVHLVRVTGEN